MANSSTISTPQMSGPSALAVKCWLSSWTTSTRTRFQLEFVFRDAKQFTGLTHCQVRNKEAMAFAFNASLSSVNVARAYAQQEGLNLSVGATKTPAAQRCNGESIYCNVR